jgi:hypothetical protein
LIPSVELLAVTGGFVYCRGGFRDVVSFQLSNSFIWFARMLQCPGII